MSSSISGLSPIGMYLSVVKDEDAAVAKAVQADPQTAANAAALQKRAPGLTSPSALLGDYTALAVLTGAFNMGSLTADNALLRQLVTQDATAANSLVQRSANTDWLHFAQATASRDSITIGFGDPATLSVAASGGGASTVTLQNAAWAAGASQQSAASPGRQWRFVLDDGSAGASIAAQLSQAAGLAQGYTVTAGGAVTAASGAPPLSVTANADGSRSYSIVLATDSSGKPTKTASVVSVHVAAGDSPSRQVAALAAGMRTAGFDATQNANGSVSIINPLAAGPMTVDRSGLVAYQTTALMATTTQETTIAMGQGAARLRPGAVIRDGQAVIGQVKSVTSGGLVTLTAPAGSAIRPGDTLDVVSAVPSAGQLAGVTLANTGIGLRATASTTAGGTTLALGAAGTLLQPGEVIRRSGTVVGTVAAATSGTVTLTAGAAVAVSAWDSLVATAPVTATSTPALADPGNVKAIISQYERAQYEASLDRQYPGMADALTFTRGIGAVTNATQLLANKQMLDVVTASLGMESTFGELDFTEQKQILTQQVDFKKFSDPSYVTRMAEQYLALKQQEAPATPADPTGMLSLFGASSGSQSLLSVLASAAGGTLSATGGGGGSALVSLLG